MKTHLSCPYRFSKQLLIVFSTLSAVMLMSCESDQGTSSTPYYEEEFRPHFHFSPENMWMNDPNGMVFYEDEYHLFYQYYPDSTVWGPMHWGHAVSTDLVRWEHLPVALYPDSLGYIFSGSAVIDWKNSSGLGIDDRPPMIAVFTQHNETERLKGSNSFQYQSIAYSHDNGRTWQKYSGNPVISNPGIQDFRDPKVIWSDEYNKWLMVFAADDHIRFYSSQNLIDWTHLSDFGIGHGAQGRPWECPDLFPIQVDGTDEEKWVLIVSLGSGGPNGGSATQYFIGDFDGTTFTNLHPPSTVKWIDTGKDNYAGVTWADVPGHDGRRIFMGWMSNWQYAQKVPTETWRSAMTIPRRLGLIRDDSGYHLTSHPVTELAKLRSLTISFKPKILEQNLNLLEAFNQSVDLLEINLTFKRPAQGPIDIALMGKNDRLLSLGFDPTINKYYIDRTFGSVGGFSENFAGLHTSEEVSGDSETVRMHMFIDRSSVELFADEGRTVMTETFFPKDVLHSILIDAQGGIELIEGQIHILKNIWTTE